MKERERQHSDSYEVSVLIFGNLCSGPLFVKNSVWFRPLVGEEHILLPKTLMKLYETTDFSTLLIY